MANTALRRGSQQEGNTDYFTGCPIGGGFIWFGLPDKIPANCRICENQTFAISQFAKLYENLGTSWGESGGNINIPDLRGRFPRGVDGAANRDPDKATRTEANTGGNTGNNVGSVQEHQVNSHKHGYIRSFIGQSNVLFHANNNTISTGLDNASIVGVSDPNNGMQLEGGNETRPKNANVYFVIRVE
jgi:microcystin-dependent protein